MTEMLDGPVIATLKVAYGYGGLFGIRLTYPLGRPVARSGGIELRPARFLTRLMRSFTIPSGEVIDTGREGMMVVLKLRDGSSLRVWSPQDEELVSVLMA